MRCRSRRRATPTSRSWPRGTTRRSSRSCSRARSTQLVKRGHRPRATHDRARSGRVGAAAGLPPACRGGRTPGGDRAGLRHPRRDPALRLRVRRGVARASSRPPLDTGVPVGVWPAHHRRTSSRRSTGPVARTATRARRPPTRRSRWPACCGRCRDAARGDHRALAGDGSVGLPRLRAPAPGAPTRPAGRTRRPGERRRRARSRRGAARDGRAAGRARHPHRLPRGRARAHTRATVDGAANVAAAAARPAPGWCTSRPMSCSTAAAARRTARMPALADHRLRPAQGRRRGARCGRPSRRGHRAHVADLRRRRAVAARTGGARRSRRPDRAGVLHRRAALPGAGGRPGGGAARAGRTAVHAAAQRGRRRRGVAARVRRGS